MLKSRTLATALIPSAPGLRLDEVTIGPDRITATLIATRPSTPCPLCGRPARRVHSAYRRTVADLPCGRFAVTLQLTVRKFFCDEAACGRRIFTERLPGVVAPSARRTTRFDEVSGGKTSAGVSPQVVRVRPPGRVCSGSLAPPALRRIAMAAPR